MARDSLTKLFVKKGGFEVINTTPFTIFFAVNFPITKDSVETEGYWKLKTGESRKFERTFYGVEPKINVYAESSNSDIKLLREAFDLPSSYNGKTYYQPQYSSNGVYAPIKPDGVFDYKTSYNDYLKPEDEAYYVLFASQNGEYTQDTSFDYYNAKNSHQQKDIEFYEGKFLIEERLLPYVYENELFENEHEAISTYINKSKSLRASLERQVKYKKLMDNNYDFGYFPYTLGVSFNSYWDDNDLGVKIQNKWLDTNILSGEMPFNEGDIITSFDGVPVFSSEDLFVLLHDHALNLYGGIANPIPFSLSRGSEIINGKTLYFFNPDFPWKKIPGWKKFLMGLSDSALYGFDDDLYIAFTKNDPWKGWQYVQDKSRLVQFSDVSYFTGNIGGIFVSPGRFLFQKAVKRQVIKTGISKRLTSLATTVILESGEAVVWSFGNKSPVLSQKKFLEEMKEQAFFGAGVGIITGSFSLKRK